MNKTIKTKLSGKFAAFLLSIAVSATAQTVTLAVQGGSGTSAQGSQTPSAAYALTTNQIVQVLSIAGQAGVAPAAINLFHSSGATVSTTNVGTFTGLTNVSVYATYTDTSSGGITYYDYHPVLVTLQITTPAASNVISNYVPADAIVIPASANGNVQIILESSPDLVNWTAANPGTYGTSAGTNRFFRVRAAVNP